MKLITHEHEKLRHAIAYFVKYTKQLGVTKLMKLLYYLDFWHYQETGRSVTGRRYYAWPFGPVPVDVWEEIKGKADHGLELNSTLIQLPQDDNEETILPKSLKSNIKFNKDVFTDREFRILEKVAVIFRDCTASVISDTSHMRNDPWDLTRKTKSGRAEIDYELSLKTIAPDTLLNIRTRQQERNEMVKTFT